MKKRKREYNRRIRDIAWYLYSISFLVSGVLGKECSMFHKHMTEKTNESYENLITVIRCKLSFIILRPAIICIRECRSNHVLEDIDKFSLALTVRGCEW